MLSGWWHWGSPPLLMVCSPHSHNHPYWTGEGTKTWGAQMTHGTQAERLAARLALCNSWVQEVPAAVTGPLSGVSVRGSLSRGLRKCCPHAPPQSTPTSVC